MYCMNCLYYRDLSFTGRALCEKTGRPAERDDRPCDFFILRGQMTDEWGESRGGGHTCR